MAVTFVASASGSDTDNNGFFDVPLPAGTANGDLVVFVCGTPNTGGLMASVPSGWTGWPDASNLQAAGFTADLHVYYKVAASEPSTYSWGTPASASRGSGVNFTLRGIDVPAASPITGWSTTNGQDYWLSAGTGPFPFNLALANRAAITAQPVVYIAYAQTTTTASGADPDRFASGAVTFTTPGAEQFDTLISVTALHSLYAMAFITSETDRTGDSVDFTNGGAGNWPGNGVFAFARLFGAAEIPTERYGAWQLV